jgi:ABC-type histidine transport system ATPase subunit
MENFGMWTVMFSKANGSMIRPTATEYMSIRMELDMKESGKMICSTDMAKRFGQITRCMRGLTMKARSMGVVSIFGRTAPATTATGMKTALKETVFINGKMAAHIQGNGKTTICMDRGYTLGLTVVDMKVNT